MIKFSLLRRNLENIPPIGWEYPDVVIPILIPVVLCVIWMAPSGRAKIYISWWRNDEKAFLFYFEWSNYVLFSKQVKIWLKYNVHSKNGNRLL